MQNGLAAIYLADVTTEKVLTYSIYPAYHLWHNLPFPMYNCKGNLGCIFVDYNV